MAHIPDGVLSLPVLASECALAAAGLIAAMRRMDDRMIPRTALFSAVFFSASLIAIPVGPSSVHLLLAGLMGLVLGILTIPAVFVALILHALLFGFGGLTTLGVNTVNIAFPGFLFGALFSRGIRRASPRQAAVLAGVCAALSVAGTAAGVALALALSASEFVPSARILLVTYLPLMLGESLITASAVGFLKRVKPELLAP